MYLGRAICEVLDAFEKQEDVNTGQSCLAEVIDKDDGYLYIRLDYDLKKKWAVRDDFRLDIETFDCYVKGLTTLEEVLKNINECN